MISKMFADYLGCLTENAALYAIAAVPLFLIFWVFGRKFWALRRIQSTPRAGAKSIVHDLSYSLLTIAIVAGLDLLLVTLASHGIAPIHDDVGKYGWIGTFLSAVGLFLFDDAYVYWTHRGMHHPRVYAILHAVHHRSTDPSPFTSLAFHPGEAIIQNIPYYILPLIVPLHFGVILFWQFFGIFHNVTAHLGYEIYPKFWTRIPGLRCKTTSTHHNMHHELLAGNYGAYFTWWDKLMGTEFADYERRHAAIFERGLPAPTLADAPDPAPAPTTVTARIGKRTYHFPCNGVDSILANALAQNVPLPYACQQGLCGQCKVKCTVGQVQLEDSPGLDPAERNAGYILTCQSTADSETLEIEI